MSEGGPKRKQVSSPPPPLRFAALFLWVAGACACTQRSEEPQAGGPAREGPQEAEMHFRDAAAERGLTRLLVSGGPDKLSILENVGTGCALFDADGDGRLDIYFANAGVLQDGRIEKGPGAAFYIQEAGGTFRDATAESGLEFRGWATGTAVGDIDSDGDPDLFVSTYGRDLLYVNEGSGRFREVGEERGIIASGFSTSAVFFDADRDGDLDLYVARYVKFDPRFPANGGRPCNLNGVPVACGPGFYEPETDLFYRNDGGGHFQEAGREAGIASAEGAYGLGVAAADFDGDGDTDVYVANDTTANFLWSNLGDGRFEDVALYRGAALSAEAQGQAGMGVAAGDADGDGRIDIFVTNYSREANAYYRNLGEQGFREESTVRGLGGSRAFLALGWGIVLADLDCDGALDLAVANGHVHPRIWEADPELSARQPLFVYRNLGGGRFADVTDRVGAAAAEPRAHRGLAAGDIDNDGDIDLVATVQDGPPVLLLNESKGIGHALLLELQGRRSNRDGAGARVEFRTASLRGVREVSRGGSYLSQSDVRVHIGLGRTRTAQVRILWPSGAVDELGELEAGSIYRVIEGSNAAAKIGRLRP